jgi:hypothetical protein
MVKGVLRFGLVMVLAVLVAGRPSSSRVESEKRTLNRSEDFVELSGKDLRGLVGAELSRIVMSSYREGQLKPAPVQVDKVDVVKRYVFPQEMNNQRDGAALDENDEVSFMAGDAGDRLPAADKPPKALRGVEVQVTDPVNNGKGWLYSWSWTLRPLPRPAIT